eukprot:s2600_g7.t2
MTMAILLQRYLTLFQSPQLASSGTQGMAPEPEPTFTGVAELEGTRNSKEDKDDVEKGMCVAEPEEGCAPVTNWYMLLVMLSVYQGYASMVGPLQAAYKYELGVEHGTAAAHVFTQAAVGVHYGKLIAKLGHNIFFACLSPRMRVMLAMVLMFVGVLIPPLLVFTLEFHWVYSVLVSYMLSGLGLGIFAPTFMSVITPMGKATKSWAIVGCPAGFATINILGLSLSSLKMPVVYIYWYIVACLPVGLYFFWQYAPHDKAEQRPAHFRTSLRQGGLVLK